MGGRSTHVRICSHATKRGHAARCTHVRTCNRRLLNEHEREFTDLSDTICSPPYRRSPPLVHSKYPLFFFFPRRGPEGGPAKRSCYCDRERVWSRREPVDRYGACAPPPGIPHREICGNFSLPDTTMYPSIPSPPSPKKCTSTSTPPCSTQARAHFVCRDNVFIIHWIIHWERGRKSGGAVLRDTVGHVET